MFTLGHSNRSMEDFLSLLKRYQITLVTDVRRYPRSEHHSQFDKPRLEQTLPKRGIAYVSMPHLGAMRPEGYEAYMKTGHFKMALAHLLERAKGETVVLLCAEKDYHHCHRRFLAQAIKKQGWEVRHILDEQTVVGHHLEHDSALDEFF